MTEKDFFKIKRFNIKKLDYLRVALEIKEKKNSLTKLRKYMIKLINYFFQSLIIYLIFLVGRLLGIKLSRIIFSKIFCLIGPFFKSKKIIKKILKFFMKMEIALMKKI